MSEFFLPLQGSSFKFKTLLGWNLVSQYYKCSWLCCPPQFWLTFPLSSPPLVKRLHFSHSPTTVLYTTLRWKLSIHPLEAPKSSMSNIVAICSRFSLSAVPLILTLIVVADFKHTVNKTFQFLKWQYSQAVPLTTEHATLCVTLTGIFSVFNNSV